MLQIRECISFVNFSFSRWNFNISLFSMGLFLSIIKMLFKFSVQRDISYYWLYFFFLQFEILSMRLLSNSWKIFIFRSIRSCGLKHVFSGYASVGYFYNRERWLRRKLGRRINTNTNTVTSIIDRSTPRTLTRVTPIIQEYWNYGHI